MINEFEQYTIWVNDQDITFKARLFLENGKHKDIEFPPGKEFSLPSQYDAAIRTQDQTGLVVGGLVPLLKKKGEANVKVHACLDYKAVAEEIELEEMTKKIAKEEAQAKAIVRQAEKKAANSKK